MQGLKALLLVFIAAGVTATALAPEEAPALDHVRASNWLKGDALSAPVDSCVGCPR
jgi:hypothetical protein